MSPAWLSDMIVVAVVERAKKECFRACSSARYACAPSEKCGEVVKARAIFGAVEAR